MPSFGGIFPMLACVIFVAPALLATTYDCTTIGPPAGSPTGINNDGVTVGNAPGNHGFIRDAAGNVTLVDYPGVASGTQLFAINNNGLVTGLWGNKFDMPGTFGFFTWDSKQGTFKPIVFPPPYDQDSDVRTIYGINDAGAIAVSTQGHVNGFFILNPDGTATALPAGTRAVTPAGLNNARQMIENAAESPAPLTAYLVGTDSSLTTIDFPNYPGSFGSTAYGLNNNGTAAGFLGLYHSAPSAPPSTAFTRDASGVYSDVVCPNGILALDLSPRAINDNGVIAGGWPGFGGFIATPLPGLAQYNSPVSSLDFGTVTLGAQAPPQNVTISNTGNARLDFGSIRMQGYPCCSSPDYTVSACISQGAAVTSLDPGASCVVSVSPLQTPSHTGTITDTVVIDDSAPGAPHTVAVSMQAVSNSYPPVPPTCRVSGLFSGSPRYVNLTTQDTNSGLYMITVLDSANANITIPSFLSGVKDPETVTVAEVDSSQDTKADFRVTGVSGYSTTCGTAIYGTAGVWKGLGGSIIGSPATGLNFDGRLEVFVRNSDNSVWHKAQTSPGGTGWSDWESLGGVITSDPVVGQDGNGELEVFAAGTDGALWHTAQTSPGSSQWSGWTSLGGAVSGNPAVVVDSHLQLEVFARGPDSALWAITQSGESSPTWSSWVSFGGYVLGDPALTTGEAGNVVAFVRGGDNSLWRIAESAPGVADTSGWTSLGGYFTGNPALQYDGLGNLDALVRGGDSGLWYIAQSSEGVWGAWNPLGGYITSDPMAGINDDGTVEVFAQGGDGGLWHIRQSAGGPWGNWSSLSGILADGVTVAQDLNDSRLEIFARAPDNTLWHIAQVFSDVWN
ncbi:MAG TPA: hypothetical protein VHZ74_01195 [Bryobacteraceae bacterium]|nr:hypothetical protein [Bryobacteraceae bacterium]